ncbi:GBS Bsp-like repeat-containing protein [Streptococcus pluranimalium]
MKKKMYKSKKHWVVAGVTAAGLLLAPGVLAEEAGAVTPSSSTAPVVTNPTVSVSEVKETTSVITPASQPVSATESSSTTSAPVSSSQASTENTSTSSSVSASALSLTAVSTAVATSESTTARSISSSLQPLDSATTASAAAEGGTVIRSAAGSDRSIGPQELIRKTVSDKTLRLQYVAPIASNEKIQYAVWGDASGQNDLKWYTADAIGVAYVDLSKHKEYGLYHVHTYKNVSGKMIGIEGGKLNLPSPWVTPEIENVSFGHYKVTLRNLPASISQVQIPVWSDKNGQDDLKWYSAKQVSSGVYEAHIDIANHKNTYGKYYVHAYGISSIAGKRIGIASSSFNHTDNRALATVRLSSQTDSTATVTVTGTSSSKPITRVRVAAWSVLNGQDDLKWYDILPKQQAAQVVVNMKDMAKQTGSYIIHAYTYYQDGSRIGTDLGTVVFKASNQVTANQSNTGFELSLTSNTVTDYSKVRVAVWSEDKGQDDLKWYWLDKSGQAQALYGNHRSSGLFHVHAYSYETGKAVFLAKTTATVPQLPSKTGSVTISSVNTSNNTFTTKISDVSSRDGLRSVRVAVWSNSNGQDDLEWQVATKQGDGSYVVTTKLANHAYMNGTYHVHVYYELANGKLSALSAHKTNITGIASKTYPMTYYSQKDPRWANKYYGKYNMEDTGCVPTVLAMIYSSIEEKLVLPTDVASWLYKNTTAFNKIGGGTYAHGIGASLKSRGYGYEVQKSVADLENTLKMGHPVMAAVGLGDFVWYSGTHEILLQGYNNGKTYVRDPYRDFLNGWYSISDLFSQQSWNSADRELGTPFIKVFKS